MLTMLVFALAAFVPSAFAHIDILGPGAEGRFWVQFTENNFTWTYHDGDISPISIVISNPEANILSGNFSIAEYLPTNVEQFAVTNVTLNVGGGYIATFYESANLSNIVATSEPFEVKALGTAPNNPLGSGSHEDGHGDTTTTGQPSGTDSAGNPAGTAPPGSTSRLVVSSFLALTGAAVATLVL